MKVKCMVCGKECEDGPEVHPLPKVEPNTILCSQECTDAWLHAKEHADDI